MIGGTGPYAEFFIIMLCWIILNPIFITIYFQKSITKRFNSRTKKIIAIFLFYLLIVSIARFSILLIEIIKLIPFLITSIISTAILIFMVGSKQTNE